MNNPVEIFRNPEMLVVTIKVRSALIGKIILSLIVVVCFALVILAALGIHPAKGPGTLIFPMAFLAFVIFVPLKMLLWNLYGKETIIVNTRSVSWTHSYGIVETRLKTQTFEALGTGFDLFRIYDGNEHGHLLFYRYDPITHLPSEIYSTNIIIPKNKLVEIDNELSDLFYHEFASGYEFIPFSKN